MQPSGSQLCSRARFWASLRVDGELSELESALLDAHLGHCASCSEIVGGFEDLTRRLRAEPLASPAPVVVARRAPSRRVLLTATCAAFVACAAVLGGLVRGHASDNDAVRDPHVIAVVAGVDTPDQLRRLRRAGLLNQRPVPREFSGEAV
jgi:hypothetical protein